MLLCKLRKDGGQESHVNGFFFLEIKKLFTIVFLHFFDGSRDSYHNHAFNAISWVLRGKLVEYTIQGQVHKYSPSIRPIFTSRSRFHKVISEGNTWVISFRGPWNATWKEYLPSTNEFITLTHGRKEVKVA